MIIDKHIFTILLAGDRHNGQNKFIGQIVFSLILILNLFIVVDMVFECLRQRSYGLKICLPAVFYMYVFSWFHSV